MVVGYIAFFENDVILIEQSSNTKHNINLYINYAHKSVLYVANTLSFPFNVQFMSITRFSALLFSPH